MKILVAVAVVALLPFWASAKTVTSKQGNANERMATGVAGPPASADQIKPAEKDNRGQRPQPARKPKIKSPPPLHDPN